MTDAAEGRLGRINSPAPVIALFLAGNKTVKFGAELELAFYKQDSSGQLRPLDNKDNKHLQDLLRRPAQHGFAFAPVDMSEEAGTMTLEIKTRPFSFARIGALVDELDRQLDAIAEVCAAKGFVVCPWSQIPDLTLGDAYGHVIDRARAKVFIDTFRNNRLEGYARNFFLNTAVQVSVSYQNPEHLLTLARRLALLTPALSTAHDNSEGRLENRAEPLQSGLKLRENLAQDGRGGLPALFFAAKTGEELVKSYINWAFDTKLLAIYDEKGGNLQAKGPADLNSFRELAAAGTGLNHQTNFDLALGMLWPHLKLAFIRQNGETTGVRLEVRACDTGPWQYASFPLIVAALAADRDFGAKVDRLLEKYGFDLKDFSRNQPLYEKSVDAALHYRDAYGTGTYSGFITEFGILVENAFARKPKQAKRLAPFFNICASGQMPGLDRRKAAPLSSACETPVQANRCVRQETRPKGKGDPDIRPG